MLLVKNPSEKTGTTVRARCYRSMKKNEDPNKLWIVFEKPNSPPRIALFGCSCAAGKGLCHHVIGLLYSLCHYQMLGLKSVPPIVSKTSRPQTWHVPNRIDGVKPRAVTDVVIQKVKKTDQQTTQEEKESLWC